jgi:putative tryptophan/tyrosine transport system substrate-binding protein
MKVTRLTQSGQLTRAAGRGCPRLSVTDFGQFDTLPSGSGGNMKRREIIVGIGSMAAAPLAARAQQTGLQVVGFLHSAAPGQVPDLLAAFQAGLKEAGFLQGQKLAIEYRWGNNDETRLPALASELVDQKVDVIATGGGDQSAMAAKKATSKIPIVSVIGGDPVAEGLVESISRPGGNLTGVAFLTASLPVKRLELLLELVPQTKLVAILTNPKNPQSPLVIDDVRKASSARGLQFHVANVGSEAEIDEAFAAMDRQKVEALVIQADPYFNNVRERLISLSSRYSIAAIQERRAFTAEGGLMSYGTSLPDVYRQVGTYCGKILKGAVPGDLPVLQPTKFEFAVNLRTAKALGITVPQVLLARADEVIE